MGHTYTPRKEQIVAGTSRKPRKPPRRVSGVQHRRNVVYGSRWQRIRPRILARDDYTCQVRGPNCAGRADRVDHIIDPVRDGGAPWDESNLRACCRPCNAWRKQGKNSPERKPQAERTRCPHKIDGRWCYELNLPGHWARRWPVAKVSERQLVRNLQHEDDDGGRVPPEEGIA
jgi:hypothetical protein